MSKIARNVLFATIVVLVLGSVLAQVLVPVFASTEAAMFPEVADLVVPYSLIAILVIACGQVALVAVWRLLMFVDRDVIFTRRALRWVDVIAVCGATATLLSAGGLIHLFFVVRLGGPGVVLGLAACLAGGLAFVTLVVVMRGLLESAIGDRADLDGVI